jgi:hypothetical protein
MTNQDLQVLLDTKYVKFTKPQRAIVDRLLKGAKLTVVNSHRMSGGEFMWVDYPGAYPSYAGKVYKAFFNIFYQIKKQTGVVVNPSDFQTKIQ